MRCFGRWHWRRWRLTHWLLSRAYVLGLIAGSGLSTHCHFDLLDCTCPGHPGWGWVADHVLIHPRKGRPYLLGWETWKWGCLLRRRHWPSDPIDLGMCGRCAPWPCCGAITEAHAPTCAEAWE